MIFLKGIVVWLLFILAECLNGALRIFWLIPTWGEVRGHQIAFVIGSGLIVAIAIRFIRWLHASQIAQLIQIGVLWLVLTLGFELALGRFVFHYSWQQFAADYDLLHGGLMPIGLLLLVLAPIIAATVQGCLPYRQHRWGS